MRLRLLRGEGGAVWNMALDEALLNGVNRGVSPPTLRLYVFSPSAVTIGRFQRVREVVDLERAADLGVDVVRRITGGGAVYHDERGEVTYSIVSPISEFPGSVVDSYRRICAGLVRALEIMGLSAEFAPINDVVIGGKKVSGSAQVRRGGALLQHGTLMYATDLDTLASLLRPPREKLRAKGLADVRARVTTVSIELGREVTRAEVEDAMIRGFSEALGAEVEEGDLLEGEEVEARRLALERYGREEWNMRR